MFNRLVNAGAALLAGAQVAVEHLRQAPAPPGHQAPHVATGVLRPHHDPDTPMPHAGWAGRCPWCEEPVLRDAGPHFHEDEVMVGGMAPGCLVFPTEHAGHVLVCDADGGNPAVWAS